jgi:hypothetical protein
MLPFENEFVSRTQTGVSLRVEILPNRGDTRQQTCLGARTAQTGALASGSDLLVSPDPFAEAADQLAD